MNFLSFDDLTSISMLMLENIVSKYEVTESR